MTDAPIALTVHPGGGVPPEWRRLLIVDWLTTNGINPADVSSDDPITVLTLPHTPSDPDEPWLVQVIVLTQYHRNVYGVREQNLLTRRPVAFQRTVPLQEPFPTDLPDGEDRGEEPQVEAVEEEQRPPEHEERAEADEQQAVRPAGQALQD
ncbi:hypothetical protein ACTWJ9_33565 (plasmid) [Streptomyces sp. GDS52]|uniref:hypothetical protein n=1 Tax=Streptomyces sp. GDS52 TaxID=3406419 RepID=UPI003FD54069